MQAAFSGCEQQWVPAPGREGKGEMQAAFSGCEQQWGTSSVSPPKHPGASLFEMVSFCTGNSKDANKTRATEVKVYICVYHSHGHR